MNKKPRADSWKYLLRFLPKSSRPVKGLATWLEQYKPLFWLKDAERLAEFVKNRKVKQVTAADIPDTVQAELIEGLVVRLQAINDWYNQCRRREAERKRLRDEAYLTIPIGERELIEKIREVAPERPWPIEGHESEEFDLLDRRSSLYFRTAADVFQWLEKPIDYRNSWLKDTLRLAKRIKSYHDAKREQVKKEAEQEFYRRQQQHAKERQRDQQWWDNWQRLYNQALGLKASNMSAYSVLGIAVGAGKDVIKAAYRQLVKQCHPDIGGNTDEFIKVQQAYEQLMR